MVSQMLTHLHHGMIIVHRHNENAKIIFGVIAFFNENPFYFETIMFRWHCAHGQVKKTLYKTFAGRNRKIIHAVRVEL